MKTTKTFIWKRGLCVALASLLLGLTACSAKNPAQTSGAGAAAGANTTVATEAQSNPEDLLAATPEDVRITEAPETTAPVQTEAATEPAATEPERKAYHCGENLTWSVTDYGALVIEGSGAMFDYDETNRAPWYEKRGEIQSLQLPDALTTIGSYAFCDCTELQYGHAFSPEYGVSHGITSIGRCAFKGCSKMELLVCSENLSAVAASAFEGCAALRELWILNKDCALDAKLDAPAGLTVCGFPGSTAEQYAQANSLSFNPIVDNRDAIAELIKQEPGDAFEAENGTIYINSSLHYNGFVPVGEKFVCQILRSELYALTEEEFQQARQSGSVEALGVNYEFTDSAETAKEWMGDYRDRDWDSYSDALAWMRTEDHSSVLVVTQEENGYVFHVPYQPNGEGWFRTYTSIGWLLLNADSPADQNGMPSTLRDFYWYGCCPKNGNHVQQLELNADGEIVPFWCSAGKK